MAKGAVGGGDDGHFFGSGGGEELADGVAFLGGEGFDAFLEGFGKFDGE